MNVSRRTLLVRALSSTALAGVAAAGLAGCATTTNPTTGAVTYGLDPSVVAQVQAVVAAVASYTPAIESIAATAAGLFGPAYTGLVTVGSAAVNTLEQALENLVTSLPVGARHARLGARLGATPAGALRGYVKTPTGYVPVFAQ